MNGDNATSLTTNPVYDDGHVLSPVGNYPSSCSGAADSNYTITYVTGLVTVGTAPLTITASSGTMVYGGACPPSRPPTRAS